MDYVTLTTPLLGVVRLGLGTVNLYTKFDDSSFSCSKDIIGAQKFKVGHMTLTTFLLRVICHSYPGT